MHRGKTSNAENHQNIKEKTGKTEQRTKKNYIQTKIKNQVIEDTPSMPTKGCSHDQGAGDLPVQIDDEETLRILSKNPRRFCFEEGYDHKTTAGI